jgi:protein O-GlcNAc transferase
MRNLKVWASAEPGGPGPQVDWPETFAEAQALAGRGQFKAFLATCQRAIDAWGDNPEMLLSLGSLLLQAGFLSTARQCFQRGCVLAPRDLRPVVNLANLTREAGDHAEARRLYDELLRHLPDHPTIRRNALVSLEYDPEVSDASRLERAIAWGDWAVVKAGGPHPRPPRRPLGSRPLRIGYLSADFCQHTVGLFVKDILRAHDPARVVAFTYSAGGTKDWVTEAIRTTTQFRDVATLDDPALATLIRQDEIDVLVDLSGHTAGSRLTVFAYRPAPVQVSWLGYFATTGLSCVDAVLLDDWHAPPGTEAQFVEPVVRLPGGRFCYQPVAWAPSEAQLPPCLPTGHITFGSFNNTAKFNDGVFDLWARIMAAVPNALLVLKWRTFNDDNLCQYVREAFARRGVVAERLDLRGPSFHAGLLEEYACVDIALDPFPFTGGLTSCEALWMGVPVVTWPQSRAVSRQTFALLSAIGLPELAAQDGNDYVRIAVALAGNHQMLTSLRRTMRDKMRASSLMEVAAFASDIEITLRQLWQSIEFRQ